MSIMARAGLVAALLGLVAFGGGGVTSQPREVYRLPEAVVDETPMSDYRFVDIEGARMACAATGSGRPILFVHGNPSSSYLWRNIIPYAAGYGRAIAVDLAGMGRSEPPRQGHRFEDHVRRMGAFIDALRLRAVTFVVHDWGATLGLPT